MRVNNGGGVVLLMVAALMLMICGLITDTRNNGESMKAKAEQKPVRRLENPMFQGKTFRIVWHKQGDKSVTYGPEFSDPKAAWESMDILAETNPDRVYNMMECQHRLVFREKYLKEYD